VASPLVATRNTCFAVISGIEDDLRAFIRYAGETANLNEVLPSDVRDTAASRWQKEHQSEILASVGSDYELLPYSDFTDLAKILSSRIRPILAGDVSWIDGVTKQLLSLAPTRNRVCHSRPLEPDDLARTLDFANELCGGTFKDSFGGTREVLDHLKRDPGYVLRLQIPSIWATEDT
jgi:LuxR family glucitol operon transcriptional activator